MATLSDLKPDTRNARRHTVRNLGVIESSLQRDGFGRSVLLANDGTIIAGNATIDAAASAGIEDVLVVESDGTKVIAVKRTDVDPGSERFHMLALADNRAAELAEWDADVLAVLQDDIDLDAFFREDELARILEQAADEMLADADGVIDIEEQDSAVPDPPETRTLADRFIVPPFSVLDARQGYWQKRKSAWIGLGIRSELGRGENALGFSEGVNERHDAGTGPYAKVSPGGSPRPATRLGKDGKTQRGDGHGRPIGAGSDGNGPARKFGQDLMRGEHVVGGGQRLTWVAGDRDPEDMDPTSRKNLAGGRKMNGRPPHGATVTQNPDGTLAYRPTNAGDGEASGTSVFDPVLCELAYRWFCPPGGTVLDPFAGGSVRGIVATKLGRQYIGVDLSAPQIDANRVQAEELVPTALPAWHVGDSRDIREIVGQVPADFIFSCPPYADLEIYSDDPRDISAMPYDEFLAAYRTIIAESAALLREDRFACFVVGDVRDGKGIYRNFVSHTIQAFEDVGLRLYNEAILVTAVGSLPIRVGRQFDTGRKLGKTHQNVLVFVKGDPRKATGTIGPVDVSDVFGHEDAIGDDPAFAELAANRYAKVVADD